MYMYRYTYTYTYTCIYNVYIYIHIYIHIYICNSVCTCISGYLHVLVYCVHINFIIIIKCFCISHNIQLMEVQKLLKIRYMKLLREVSNTFRLHYVLM